MLPKIAIIATGGTIAGLLNDDGYEAGVVGIKTILEKIPNAKKFGEISTTQLANIDSADISSEIWLKIAQKITKITATTPQDSAPNFITKNHTAPQNSAKTQKNETATPNLATAKTATPQIFVPNSAPQMATPKSQTTTPQNHAPTAIIITHGTDTMEETAFFLYLTAQTPTTTILTGAMWSFDAKNSDGVKNLTDALNLATKAQNIGVVIAMAGRILSPKFAFKSHTKNKVAFLSQNSLDFGKISGEKVDIFCQNHAKISAQNVKKSQKFSAQNFALKFPPFCVENLKNLPPVGIIFCHANDENIALTDAFLKSGVRGIVVVAFGAGNLPQNLAQNLAKIAQNGVKIVVSTRVLNGGVIFSQKYAKMGFLSARKLSPQKARILLMLALTKTSDNAQIQGFFDAFC